MYDVPWVEMIHPDIKQCEADGWDGIVLGRIIECAACGAEVRVHGVAFRQRPPCS